MLIEALRVELEALRRQLGRGLLELVAAAEYGRAGREGQGQGQGRDGPTAGRAAGPALARGAFGRDRAVGPGTAPPQAGWAAGASWQWPGPGDHPGSSGADRALWLRRLRRRPGRRSRNGRYPGAGVRPAGL